MKRTMRERASGGPGGPPVFISYAREANQEHARALHEQLSEEDEQAFLDEADIKPGDHFPPVLVDALLASRVIVIFASEAYFGRWYCQWELDAMLSPFLSLGGGAEESEEKAALAPVIVVLPPEGVAVPEMPSLPPRLRNSHWLRAGELEGLARQVRERLADEPRTLAERLEAMGQSSAQLRFRLQEEVATPSAGNLAGMRHYPPELSPSLGTSFMGRSVDLWRIHRTLSTRPNPRGEGAARAAAVTGGGGFGKTRLMLEYLHRFGPSHYSGGLFWVDADVAEDRLEEQFHGILCTLKPEVPDLVTFRKSKLNAAVELANALASALEEIAAGQQRVLYVVDNVPEPELGKPPKPLRTWCPAMGRVSLLVTSRARVELGTEGVQGLELSTPAPEAAVALLTERVDRRALEESSWFRLAKRVGYLPLALELLNRAMRTGGLEPEELLSEMESQGLTRELDQKSEELQGYASPGTYRGATQAYSISYRKLSEPERRAARLIAWMAPEPIPLELLKAMGTEVASSKVRGVLASRHFVTGVRTGTFGSMHQVLADYLRTQSAAPLVELRQVCQGLITVMKPSAVGEPKAWTLMDACRPHAESVFGRLAKDEERSKMKDAIHLGLGLGLFLSAQGLAKQAQGILERVVELASENLGPEHPDTLTAMDNLANTLFAQGDLEGARRQEEDALKVSRRVLGEEHSTTLTIMSNLAGTLHAQGDPFGARRLEERVLEVLARKEGAEHLATLTAMSNLAETLRLLGDLEGARGYQERVLEGRTRLLGGEHPGTLTAMGNLAGTLFELGERREALGYQKHVLEVSERVLGEKHPDTLRAIGNLAGTLFELGERREALGYQKRVLELERQVLGEEHPDTLIAMGNLAGMLFAQGDVAGARGYQERVRKGRERVLGEEHPLTLMAMDNLSEMLAAQGDLEGAREYQERLLKVFERRQGKEHPSTLRVMNTLAMLLRAQDDLKGARGYQEQVLEVLERILGKTHPVTLKEMNELAGTLFELGELDRARAYLEWVLKERARVLGKEHPDTRNALRRLALVSLAQGRRGGAGEPLPGH